MRSILQQLHASTRHKCRWQETGAIRGPQRRLCFVLAPWMVRQTLNGVVGMLTSRISNALRASTRALTTAAGAGVVPPSPPAFMPKGFVGDRTSTISDVNDGRVLERGMA